MASVEATAILTPFPNLTDSTSVSFLGCLFENKLRKGFLKPVVELSQKTVGCARSNAYTKSVSQRRNALN